MDELIAVDQRHPAGYWHRLEDCRLQCDLCPRDCKLREGQRGACFVRGRVEDRMVLTTYGRSSGFCFDPIEKKPLNHFFPGSSVFSFGTAGCNLACKVRTAALRPQPAGPLPDVRLCDCRSLRSFRESFRRAADPGADPASAPISLSGGRGRSPTTSLPMRYK